MLTACNGKICEDSKMHVAEQLAKITEQIERVENSNEAIKLALRESVPALRDHPALQPIKNDNPKESN